MRPTPIPDEEIWEGAARMVIGPPAGTAPTDDTIRPVEVLVEHAPDGGFIFRSRVVLEPGDLERLAAGEPFWVSQWGHQLQPFDVAMTEPQ